MYGVDLAMLEKAEVLDKDTMKALSTETRQQILRLLKNRPYTASELSKLLNKHVTTVTEHLGVLERSGVVRKKDSTNKWVYYALSDKGEKLFKPYYSWVLLFSLGIIVFAVGIVQIAFVSYQATAVGIAESTQAAQGAAPAVTQAAQASELNYVLGVILILVAVAIFWLSIRRRSRRMKDIVRYVERPGPAD